MLLANSFHFNHAHMHTMLLPLATGLKPNSKAKIAQEKNRIKFKKFPYMDMGTLYIYVWRLLRPIL